MLQVLMALQSDPAFFPELFRRLRDAEPGSEAWRDLVAFLQVGQHGCVKSRERVKMQRVGTKRCGARL